LASAEHALDILGIPGGHLGQARQQPAVSGGPLLQPSKETTLTAIDASGEDNGETMC
jgi:hypothetical protein